MKPWFSATDTNASASAALAAPSDRPGRARKPGLANAIARRAVVVTWLCGLGAMSAFLPSLPEAAMPDSLRWLAGLVSHWQWLYAGLALAGALLAVSLRSRRPSLALLPPLAMVAAAWLHASPGASVRTASGKAAATLTVASANLNFERSEHAALAAWLLSADAPDVIALQEFTPSAMALVTRPELLAAYPYRALEPSEDQFGLGVLSKHPIASTQRVLPADTLATLKLRLVLDVNGHGLALTAVHPMPPISSAYARERDASLRQEAGLLTGGGMPGILLGDMNDSPWSTGLRGAAPLLRASGLAPTWPNLGGWLSILPLDHVLVTPGLRVEDAALGADLGSDHRPVRVRPALHK
ncbi:endonuclease/exonuclease/phosphatase family protein [Comamonas flocculans]|uniref:Endonuclease/exonuclease/phosphatase family protein n=1 Tax=Comamonas flocculans TaxID=2597701 RepID=A0A5B8RVV0_9BURK|nr:endonuclease/exonuclease/phosphatase family protein [Comamonas flocculans]QEA12858.1 endonuclease/exonuclease/phosphatase family protein [Comamonas flocculans]